MPKRVGRVHDHLLPVVANLEVGEVWQCDCSKLFQVVPGGPAGQERAWGTIENDPAEVDFIQVEAVPEEAAPEGEEETPAKEE